MLDVDGLLIDLDGTVYQGSAPIPGAVDAIRRLDEAGIPVLFTTNTSRKPRRAVVEGLVALGIHIEPDRVLTAPVAAARWLASEGLRRILPLLPEATHEDLAALEMVGAEGSPDAVVVGDLGSGFTFERLNGAFLALRDGARPHRRTPEPLVAARRRTHAGRGSVRRRPGVRDPRRRGSRRQAGTRLLRDRGGASRSRPGAPRRGGGRPGVGRAGRAGRRHHRRPGRDGQVRSGPRPLGHVRGAPRSAHRVDRGSTGPGHPR